MLEERDLTCLKDVCDVFKDLLGVRGVLIRPRMARISNVKPLRQTVRFDKNFLLFRPNFRYVFVRGTFVDGFFGQ